MGGKLKLTYEYVKAIFEKEGYALLSTDYINSYTKLECICPKGHLNAISFNKFSQGRRCSLCAGNIKHSYTYILEQFKKEGYILLSKEYKNAHTKLKYVCDKDHAHNITFNSFQQGCRCPTCAGNVKYTYEEVKCLFNSYNYELLTTQYNNVFVKLKCMCPKGHINYINFNNFKNGNRCNKCNISNKTGSGSPSYKGGVTKLNLPLYATYASQLEKYHTVYKVEQDGLELLGVECKYCEKVFVPNTHLVKNRVRVIIGAQNGEGNFYCSEKCKEDCPVHRQSLYLKGDKPYKNNRPLQAQWSKMVKERDNYTCQKCGNVKGRLIAHHVRPVVDDPVESADIDNGITLCEVCDKLIHSLEGCTYEELKCKKK